MALQSQTPSAVDSLDPTTSVQVDFDRKMQAWIHEIFGSDFTTSQQERCLTHSPNPPDPSELDVLFEGLAGESVLATSNSDFTQNHQTGDLTPSLSPPDSSDTDGLFQGLPSAPTPAATGRNEETQWQGLTTSASLSAGEPFATLLTNQLPWDFEHDTNHLATEDIYGPANGDFNNTFLEGDEEAHSSTRRKTLTPMQTHTGSSARHTQLSGPEPASLRTLPSTNPEAATAIAAAVSEGLDGSRPRLELSQAQGKSGKRRREFLSTSHDALEGKRPGLKRRKALGKSPSHRTERLALANRFCFHVSSDPHMPTELEYRKYSEEDLEGKKALSHQGGACVRCKIEHRKCDGGNPCKPCLSFWNANQMSKTIVWNECVRAKLRDVSPFASSAKQEHIWRNFVMTSYFHDILQEQKAQGVFRTNEWTPTTTCPVISAQGQHVRDSAKEGHCVFTSESYGLQFYYAIMALLVEYQGCAHAFQAVIDTAGNRALQALDNLMNLREFEQKRPNENCGLLICLFYGLIAFQRLRNRCERARTTRIHLWEEYKTLDIDIERLKAAIRIIGHFFLVVCERLGVAADEWYGEKGHRLGSHGFHHVRGMCKFVSTFESEMELKDIKKLLKGLPIIAERRA